MPTFSIIIPVKPDGFVAACEHLNHILPDDPRFEIILAEGCAPSRQRNLAAHEAVGDILYFLDDDSLILPENLYHCRAGMNDPNVAVVGGPSITPPSDNWLQQLFGSALASPFGSGAVHNRYRVHGETHKTTDKELILCNLAVRRQVFIDLGGFNERLYPNEENEFLERVAAAGYTMLHDPSMYVFRSQRRTLKAFIRQMFSYGRGRGEQTLLTSSYSISSFIPLFFVIYLVISLFCIKYLLLLMPLMIYMAAAFFSAIQVLTRTGRPYSLFLIGLYPLMHCVNGIGLLWGLLKGKPAVAEENHIRIRKMPTEKRLWK
jgi:cellulose synthase/poly-beta-1,6-N-acetylglucosamine synthase-like glycosyltransferase